MIDNAKSGDYKIRVQYDWQKQPLSTRDYTVRVYFKEKVRIVDQFGKTNEIDMTRSVL